MIGKQNESKLMMQSKVVFVSRQRESTEISFNRGEDDFICNLSCKVWYTNFWASAGNFSFKCKPGM